MNTVLYEGPVARALGGADIAWMVGVLVAGGLYIGLLGKRLGKEVDMA
jgi:NCS1 family nucleobase:cation symporter-1